LISGHLLLFIYGSLFFSLDLPSIPDDGSLLVNSDLFLFSELVAPFVNCFSFRHVFPFSQRAQGRLPGRRFPLSPVWSLCLPRSPWLKGRITAPVPFFLPLGWTTQIEYSQFGKIGLSQGFSSPPLQIPLLFHSTPPHFTTHHRYNSKELKLRSSG